MYNLNTEEILMVDGGGDGGSFIKTSIQGYIAGEVIGAGLGYLNNALGGNNNYSNNSGVSTGTNQNYGGYGLDSGGGMMQAGGSRGGYGY
ncbi:hypothetical protein L1D55_23375 [Vibrio sp. Isolate22]|uniref:hypothetical protein n=1 Tax=Vibrio sp. Isolate22 TaxID=2908532 RepID=UPI001EFD88D0|nr:hypothetical protein [Vibrio sp. Isolate22]MCG9694629.1 hypothetical protein [Vibrio sp. Isolate22]